MNFPIPVHLTVKESEQVFNLTVQETEQQHKLGVDMKVVAPYPTYTGVYAVTPSDGIQILHTHKTLVEEDIVVDPIPNNYGLITWNGAYLTIS